MIKGKVIQQVFLGGASLYITGIDLEASTVCYVHTRESQLDVIEDYEIDDQGTLRTASIFFHSSLAQKFIEANK